jgi:hypothetical protein
MGQFAQHLIQHGSTQDFTEVRVTSWKKCFSRKNGNLALVIGLQQSRGSWPRLSILRAN